ncbi:hypothetical protein TKK_0011571 [Trichogramma kaykai]|uniref:Retrotransposon gag domain-containing protein n=1 Tax=Trichogramma kaykai TaxID=54128 RepID=A0ABD2WS44_9HYME
MDLNDSTKRKYKLYEFVEELNAESRVEYLEELELKSDGDRDTQEQILINRLKGNYTANDFAPSDTACDEATQRARRDEKLLNLTTKLNLDTSEHDGTSASEEHEKTVNPTVLDEENIRVLIAKMQRELQETKERTSLELCQLTKSNELLAQRNKELLSQLASSTRLDPLLCGTKPRHINFQDTFRLDYYNRDNASSSPIVDTKQAEKSRQQPSHKSPPLSTTSAAYDPSRSGGVSSGPRSMLNTSTYHSDVGAIVRKWKVEFNGEKGSSVEEFIQRVGECRRLARLSDEDLLDSITELLTGQARLWCRQERSQWTTWKDFCTAARRCYGIDRRYQQKLELEAERRTQGRTEPVNHYVYCLLTIIGKLAEPWTVERKLDLLHNNMLPSLQKQVPRYKARSIDEFVELARDAENLHSAEKLYQPPIPSKLSMMPETAWDEPEAREKPGSAKLASLSEPIDDIAKMIEKLLDKKLQGLTTAITTAASNADSRVGTKKRITSPKGKSNADKAKSTREPANDKNKNREAGPQAQVACWGCSWPGYIRPRCPDCSGNAEKEE